jgi:hypothetical protein
MIRRRRQPGENERGEAEAGAGQKTQKESKKAYRQVNLPEPEF